MRFWLHLQWEAVVLNTPLIISTMRSSRSQVLCKKDVLKNFAKFKGKDLCLSLFLVKLEALSPAHVFSDEFCKIFKNSYFVKHLRMAASVWCRLIFQKHFYFHHTLGKSIRLLETRTWCSFSINAWCPRKGHSWTLQVSLSMYDLLVDTRR